MKLIIKETSSIDNKEILNVHRDAFENYGADEIEVLVSDLLGDKSAMPIVSLMAYSEGEAVGHILFTKATIENSNNNLSVYILAPLAVRKEYQNKGIGGQLIEEGRKRLKELGTDIIFVLGHITYYPKYGFINNSIKEIGYEATFKIEEKNYDAWMYMPLTSVEKIKENPGRVICADSMNKKEYWVE